MGPGLLVPKATPLYVAGAAATVLVHLFLGGILLAAGTASPASTVTAEQHAVPEGPRRRVALPERGHTQRRNIEGPWHRAAGFSELRFDRRVALMATSRRAADSEINFPFRSLAYGSGRRGVASGWSRDRRGLDFPPRDEEVLEAMLIPKLGGKIADPKKLPKLVKYEQTEKHADAVNIENSNNEARELKKAARKKKAQLDRRRKKRLSFGEIIDAPDDDDPRKRASQLDGIIGVKGGSVHGQGTEGRAGDIYLGKVERALRTSFVVPVFLTEEELKRLRVDVMITQIDEAGRVRKFRVTRKSGNSAYDGAAMDAVRRFAPSEGGSKTLPAPPPEMLELINRRGVLVKLEGRTLK